MINLTTLSAVKTLLEETGSSFDVQILQRIEDVSFRVQTVYDIDLKRQTYVEVHDGGTKRLYIRNPPIITITEIRYSRELDFTNGEIIPASEYAIVNGGWDIAHQRCWQYGPSSHRVTYISGYVDALDVATTVPKWLQNTVAKQVAFEFQHRKSEGLSSVDYPDGSISKPNPDFLRAVVTSLNTLRKYKIG